LTTFSHRAVTKEDKIRADAAANAELHEQIARGRQMLATSTMVPHPHDRNDRVAVSDLISLLWRPEIEVRRAAALGLAGGDGKRPYEPQYGHFATSFLRYVAQHSPHGRPPTSAIGRHSVVVAALRSMLEQSNNDICAMSNMHYSFLSNSLYLALLSTCRDVIEGVRRVCDGALHAEVCHLLWSLAQVRAARRLNPQDADALTTLAGQALAAMPADEIYEFWRWLSHHNRARRRAVAPTLRHLHDPKSVPHLLHALAGQPVDIAQPLVSCLGRIGDVNALPALADLANSRHRSVRNEAQNAVAAIRRANAGHPSRTLLRPIRTKHEDPSLLLRSVDTSGNRHQTDQLLRPMAAEENA
jgi:hypothetical protein